MCMVVALVGGDRVRFHAWLRYGSARNWGALRVAAGAGTAQAALTYLADGKNYGLVSQRVGGLFSLPSPVLIFVVAGLLAFVTVFLAFQVGVLSRDLTKPSTQ
ncbi:MAG: hypothetical protein HC902_00840 [Calothrix sp. SM1_5_4]|nr:hypothetical protein [Calothrix sp. SM1_5_4]